MKPLEREMEAARESLDEATAHLEENGFEQCDNSQCRICYPASERIAN